MLLRPKTMLGAILAATLLTSVGPAPVRAVDMAREIIRSCNTEVAPALSRLWERERERQFFRGLDASEILLEGTNPFSSVPTDFQLSQADLARIYQGRGEPLDRVELLTDRVRRHEARIEKWRADEEARVLKSFPGTTPGQRDLRESRLKILGRVEQLAERTLRDASRRAETELFMKLAADCSNDASSRFAGMSGKVSRKIATEESAGAGTGDLGAVRAGAGE